MTVKRQVPVMQTQQAKSVEELAKQVQQHADEVRYLLSGEFQLTTHGAAQTIEGEVLANSSGVGRQTFKTKFANEPTAVSVAKARSIAGDAVSLPSIAWSWQNGSIVAAFSFLPVSVKTKVTILVVL